MMESFVNKGNPQGGSKFNSLFICFPCSNEFPLIISFYQTFSLNIALPSVASGFITQLMGIIPVPSSYLTINEWMHVLFQAQDKYSAKVIIKTNV